MRRTTTATSLTSAIAAALVGLLASLPAFADETLATIDGVAISYDEFERYAFANGRQRFYHGKPLADAELIEFRQSAADELIERKLLVAEARRLGIAPDETSIDVQLSRYEQQYAGTERWEQDGGEMLARLRAHFEEESLLGQIETRMSLVEPDDGNIRAYYDENIDKFTEPEQARVSVILLSVAPSASKPVWDAARAEATGIIDKIHGGAKFSEFARMHSADPSAANGGDMGYLHAGMLAPEAQQAVAELSTGDIAEPVTVLEGVVVLQLTGRRAARVQPFDSVSARAADLWRRDAGATQRTELVARLRQEHDVQVDSDYLAALPGR